MEGLHYPCSENKGADQLRVNALISFAITAKLICVFVFAYTKSRFSHDEARMGTGVLQMYIVCQRFIEKFPQITF